MDWRFDVPSPTPCDAKLNNGDPASSERAKPAAQDAKGEFSGRAQHAGFRRAETTTRAALRERPRGNALRVGFVPLIDAAPLIVAHELGYFEHEGLRVRLDRQVGWANVRDKLTYSHLDASHALLGMPPASAMRVEGFAEPLVSVMALGSGGNAITLSRRLAERGVRSAATLARWVHDRHNDRQPVLAHVFGCSTHHYLLREWLAAAGIGPDLHVRLCVIPPPQMARHLEAGHLDGFCAGEPWNTLAEQGGFGSVVAPTTDIVPGHPEKVLAVSRRWAAHHGDAVRGMVRALLRACLFCDDPANVPVLAELLARPHYVGAPAGVIEASLRVDRTVGLGPKFTGVRPADWRMRSFAAATFPGATHAAWLVEQMVRWGHAPADTDPCAVARACTDARFYRDAAADLGLECPADEFAPMPLRGGAVYDPAGGADAGDPVGLALTDGTSRTFGRERSAKADPTAREADDRQPVGSALADRPLPNAGGVPSTTAEPPSVSRG